MRLSIRTTLAALLFTGAVALNSSSVSAQDKGAAAAASEAAASVRSIPTVGIPFASGKFLGTVEILGFGAEGKKLFARTRIRTGQKTTSAKLSVKVLRTSCEHFELDIGAPPGAKGPLRIIQHRGNSDLNVTQLCDLANAKTAQAQAAALNERDNLAAEVASSCPWYEVIGCSAAIAACGATCALGPEVCVPCLAGIGAGSCISCFFNIDL